MPPSQNTARGHLNQENPTFNLPKATSQSKMTTFLLPNLPINNPTTFSLQLKTSNQQIEHTPISQGAFQSNPPKEINASLFAIPMMAMQF